MTHNEFIVIDIHNFIFYNDEQGHFNGDTVIEQIESGIAMRSNNFKRIGGDKWCVISTVAGTNARDLSRHLLKLAADNGVTLNIGISKISFEDAIKMCEIAYSSGGGLTLYSPLYRSNDDEIQTNDRWEYSNLPELTAIVNNGDKLQ